MKVGNGRQVRSFFMCELGILYYYCYYFFFVCLRKYLRKVNKAKRETERRVSYFFDELNETSRTCVTFLTVVFIAVCCFGAFMARCLGDTCSHYTLAR